MIIDFCQGPKDKWDRPRKQKWAGLPFEQCLRGVFYRALRENVLIRRMELNPEQWDELLQQLEWRTSRAYSVTLGEETAVLSITIAGWVVVLVAAVDVEIDVIRLPDIDVDLGL